MFARAIARVSASMERTLGGQVTTIVSASGHSALVVGPVSRLFSTDALRADVAVTGGGRVTAVLDDNSGGSGNSDLSRAERLSMPVTLLVLLIAFGALVAAVVPGAAWRDRGDRRVRPARTDQPGVPARLEREDGRAADRDGGRRRLRAVLRDPLARGASARARLARCARADRAYLRATRCSSPGTTVAIAMAGQFVIGTDIFNGIASRHDRGDRLRRRRVGHRPAGGARAARPADRPRPHPVPAAPGKRRRLAVLAGGGRPRPAPAGAVAARVGRAARRARDPRARPARRPSRAPSDLARACPASLQARDHRRLSRAPRRRRSSSFAWPAGEQAAAPAPRRSLERLAAARGIAHPPFSAGGSLDGTGGHARAAAQRGRRQRREQARGRGPAQRADPADARPRPRRAGGASPATPRADVDFTAADEARRCPT